MSNFWLPKVVNDLDARQRMQMAKDMGFAGIIAGTQIPSVCAQQVNAAVAVGMWADVYHYLKFDVLASRQAEAILDAVDGIADRINIVWLDFEAAPPASMSTENMRLWISILVDILRASGLRLGIYTRKLWWELCTGDTEALSNLLLLWPTEYDLSPPFNQAWWDAHGFGGWAAPTWVQFAADANIAGMNVDINERYAP